MDHLKLPANPPRPGTTNQHTRRTPRIGAPQPIRNIRMTENTAGTTERPGIEITGTRKPHGLARGLGSTQKRGIGPRTHISERRKATTKPGAADITSDSKAGSTSQSGSNKSLWVYSKATCGASQPAAYATTSKCRKVSVLQ